MEQADHPSVIVSPPLLYGLVFLFVLAMNWFWPLPLTSHSLTRWVGLLTLAVGLALGLWARRALRQAGTNINPSLPTTMLVASGVCSRSRNPLYLALSLTFLDLLLIVNSL